MSGIDLTSKNVLNKLYKQGNDGGLWMIEHYFLVPSCHLVNLNTGDRIHFGLGGLTNDSFELAHELPSEVASVIHSGLGRAEHLNK